MMVQLLTYCTSQDCRNRDCDYILVHTRKTTQFSELGKWYGNIARKCIHLCTHLHTTFWAIINIWNIIFINIRSNHASQASQPVQSPPISGYTRPHEGHTAVFSPPPESLSMVRCCKSLSSSVNSWNSVSVLLPFLSFSHLPCPSSSLIVCQAILSSSCFFL